MNTSWPFCLHQDSLHTETIVQTARVDAIPAKLPPPAHGGAQPISPTKDVQVSVAERNDMRAQLRKALNDLQQVSGNQ